MSKPLIKICGNTSAHDAKMCADAGADYLGIIIEHAPSPRSVSLQEAQEIARAVSLPIVAVTVNRTRGELLKLHSSVQSCATGGVILQLHGDESPQLVEELKRDGLTVWSVCSGTSLQVLSRARLMQNAGADALLVDAREETKFGTVYGGTGHIADWQAARELVINGARVVLAGGLTPENVTSAIAEVRPWMVDVVSGVEAAKGVKDENKVRQFIAQAG